MYDIKNSGQGKQPMNPPFGPRTFGELSRADGEPVEPPRELLSNADLTAEALKTRVMGFYRGMLL
jgi:hypothetical protein